MAKKEYKTDPTPPTDMFVRAMAGFGCGSPDMECGWCGRMHLCPDSESYKGDDDEGAGWKEDCVKQHKEDPDGVILHWDWDAVSGQEINSIVFVIDCPCNGLARFEKFIWAERRTIRNYLQSRIDHEYDLALQEKLFNKVAGIGDTPSIEKKDFW